jgi:hypothetical protein
VVEVRAVHDLEVGAVIDREAHVGHTGVEEVPRLLSCGEGVGQEVVALGGHGSEEGRLVTGPADRVWAEVLATMCRARRIVVRGTYLTTPAGGTRRLS